MTRLALLCLAATMLTSSPALAAPSPYALRATTLLPKMPEGDFDQLVADVPHNRLYVSAEDGGTMYVFDLRTGALVNSGGAVASPHKVVLDAQRGHLLVADGADASVKVLDTKLAQVARIAVGPKPDTGVLDPANHIFYVGSRDPKAPDTASIISAISTETYKVLATYSVPATTLKGLVLDTGGHRLFVSMRDKNAIDIVHLDSKKTESWQPAGLRKNVPLAYDPAHHALYAGSRSPGELDVIDATDGHLRQTLPATETADSMNFDGVHNILYVSGDTGMSRYRIGADGTVQLLETDPALDGKTSLYVPQLRRLYVMRRRNGAVEAALTVFQVQ